MAARLVKASLRKRSIAVIFSFQTMTPKALDDDCTARNPGPMEWNEVDQLRRSQARQLMKPIWLSGAICKWARPIVCRGCAASRVESKTAHPAFCPAFQNTPVALRLG